MSENAMACPKCGAKISGDAPQGLCPKCLLQQASFPTEATGSAARFRPEPPSIDALAGAFPQLEIVELIGRGGMGFVFKARQPKLDRLVALKILAETLSADPSFAERFTREGRALARLSHPNIVTIHDFGQAGPFFYLLMEFIDGVNLRQAMQARQITASEALAIVPKICEALQYAHGEGILHRDIKPDNILLDAKGRVKIADFGIAKLLNETGAQSSLTGSGATLGTVHYMAPEQIERPNEVDHRADIYSLGVVFYEMLTGELPIGRFPAPSEKSAVDPRLDKVVFKTLAKEPAKRPQTAGEVGTEVQTISSTERPTSKGGAPKVARCYISTPEHLRTWFGRQLIYTGRGELRLEAKRLIWNHGRHPAIVIPLESITGLTLAEFSRRAKPTGLNYISVTWMEAEQSRRILLIPNRGPFCFTWKTNEVVADWFAAIQQAVQSATGSVPPSAKEQTEPLPGARVPPHRIGLAKAVAFAFIFLVAVFLLSRLFRHPADVPSFEPAALVTNATAPGFIAEGQPSIIFSFAEGDSQRIHVDSPTDLGSDAIVKPVISYNRGPWGRGGGTTSDNYWMDRDGPKRQFHAEYNWFLPKDFATAFLVSAEVQRVTATMLNSALPLNEGSVLEVFSISNKDGQTVSGGLEYTRRAVDEKNTEQDAAILENFRSSTTEGIAGSYTATIPRNYRLEAFCKINDELRDGTVRWGSEPNRIYVRWPFDAQNIYLLSLTSRMQEGGPLTIPTNGPVEAFALTNIANLRAFHDVLSPARTNVIRGMLQLVPSPVSNDVAR